MNIVYRLVWSDALNMAVVAPETAKGRKKGSGRTDLRKALILSFALISPASFGVTHQWLGDYTFPAQAPDQQIETGVHFNINGVDDNDGTAREQQYLGGTTLDIEGPIPAIELGSNGSALTTTLRDALLGGRLVSITATAPGQPATPITAENIDNYLYSTNVPIPQQNQEINVVVPGLEGSQSIIKIYDSSTFGSDGSASISSIGLALHDPASIKIYNNLGIARITDVGGTVNVRLGDDTGTATLMSAPVNTMAFISKQSTLTSADGTGANASAINWISDNYIDFSPPIVLSTDTETGGVASVSYSQTITLPAYGIDDAGETVRLADRTFNIQSPADIVALNNWLTQSDGATPNQIQLWLNGEATINNQFVNSASTAQNAYDSLIRSILTQRQSEQIDWEYHIWQDGQPHVNNGTLAIGQLEVIYATGANATGTVTQDSSLAVSGASSVMHATQGAIITNNGAINSWRESSGSPGSEAMRAEDSTAINNGIINAGLFIEKDGTNQNRNNVGSGAMHGTGGSVLTNSANAIINVALTGQDSNFAVGMRAEGTTQARNSGNINVVNNVNNAQGKATGYGADISDSATFTNSGNIYVGTQAQTSTTDPYTPVDMIGGALQSAGVITSSGGNVTNAAGATITIGQNVRNAVGMLANGATGAVINDGDIIVLGQKVNDFVASNIGLLALNTTAVTNNGNIRIAGDNNIALNVLAGQANASADSNNGTITVDGGGDLNYRNYAVFVEGQNGYQATANILSNIELNAVGAVGVHARGNADINVAPTAVIDLNGADQIGYYAYGPDARINLGTPTLSDNGQQGATLFLIDHGATFTGSTSATPTSPYELTVSGTDSVAVHANGRDDDTPSNLLTGNASINVVGDRAVGVKVTGGATGTITDGAISLNGNNTTAVVVDGRDYKITGAISADTLPTLVVSDAEITTQSTQDSLNGYNVSWGGQLILNADSSLSLNGINSTGVYLHEGGIATNNSSILVQGSGNWGVHILNNGQLTNNSTISVQGASGSNNVGVRVQGTGALVNKLGEVTANGGLAAVQLLNDAALDVQGQDNRVTASNGADGILMDTGARSLNMANTTIDVSGTGAGINNRADSANITLNGVTINAQDGAAIRTAVTFTAGDGSNNVLNVQGTDGNFTGAGFAFEGENGANTTGDLTIGSGYQINVNNATGTATGDAIRARTIGNVTSAADININAAGGAAIFAPIVEGTVTNHGNINSNSDGSPNNRAVIQAANARGFTNTGTINSSSTTADNSVVDISGSAANRTISNTGTITAAGQDVTLINAGGAANNTIINQGNLLAASSTATAILTGSGNDAIELIGGNVRGLINTGTGTDRLDWNSGTLDGEVNFDGAGGGNIANVGNVDLSTVRHILTNGTANNQLALTNTHTWNSTSGTSALIGSLAGDDLTIATNIGTGWSNLTVSGAEADIRIVNDLQLAAGPVINVNGGATLRSGDNIDGGANTTLNNYNIATSGAASRVIFDGVSLNQIYSGVISGEGGFERAATGTTTLLGENTYTGNTLIDATGALQIGDGGTTGSLSAQTAIIDNGLLTINLAKELTLGGAISGTGAFHQIGTGLTRLTGANGYQAETNVDLGTLIVNGNQSAATGLTTVAAGATLGGLGTLGGGVVMNGNSNLNPGDSGTGTLSINGDLTLSPQTQSNFDLGQAYVVGGALNDLVNVGGNLDLKGTVNVTTTPGGTFGPGVYRLFNYGGSLTGANSDRGDPAQTLAIGRLPTEANSDEVFVQTSIDKEVNLVNLTDMYLQFWDGGDPTNHGPTGIEGNGVIDGGVGFWLAPGGGGDNNWTNLDGIGNEPWQQASFAVFQGEGAEVTVSQERGEVIFAGAQFAVDNYIISGDPLKAVQTINATGSETYPGQNLGSGELLIRVGAGGAGADITTTINSNIEQLNANDALTLVKWDPGRLILNGNNNYAGGTRIDDGTLQVSTEQNLGVLGTSITINNNAVLQNGADFTTQRQIFLGAGGGQFDLNGFTLNPTALISGDGALTVFSGSAQSNSTLNLDRANDYQGETTVTGTDRQSEVVVNANTTGAFGRADSLITLNRGSTVNLNNATQAEQHSFNVEASTLSFNNQSSAAASTIQGLTDGVINFTGAANGGQAQITLAATSAMDLFNDANAGQAFINNAGRVSFFDNASAESATIANNAGGVVSTAFVNDTTTIGSLSGAGNVELGDRTLREGALNLNDTISGVIADVLGPATRALAPGGSLVKIGTGTLTLTGDNSYTGQTIVESGVLLVNGNQAAATGNVNVYNGATLGGAGVMGGVVTVDDNGRLAAGADLTSVGILTMGGLTLAENAQLDYQLGQAFQPGGAFNDLINVNGDLNLNGKLNITQTDGGRFDVGIYRLINYTGNFTNNILDIATAPPAATDLYVQTSIPNQVNLVNRTGTTLRFWDGYGGPNDELKDNGVIDGGDGIWQASAGNDNWTTDETDPAGVFNAPFSDNAFAVFQGESGTVTVDNSFGTVRISGAQFAVDGYLVTGEAMTTDTADTVIRVGDGTAPSAAYTATIDSAIIGSGGLNKADVGTLILNGNNGYAGGTRISGGTLQVSGDNNLGAPQTGITINGGTLRYGAAFDTARQVSLGANNGTIDTAGQNVALLTSVGGVGQLTKTGEGQLTLLQDSTYSGGTVINQGALRLGNGGATGSVSGDILNNGILQVDRSNVINLNGAISGSGQLWQQGVGTTILSGQNSYSGLTLVERGSLLAQGANTLSAASPHVVSSGALLGTGGTNQTVSGLLNQGTVSLTGANVGATLTTKGNYIGLDGVIRLAVEQRPGENGIADRLVVDGGRASGTTTLDIDVSRLGGQSVGDGIEVVSALNGATTTAQTTRDAFRLSADRLEAGAYEYRLFAGNAQGRGENWYLRTAYRPEVPLLSGIAPLARQSDMTVLGNLHQRVGDEVVQGQAGSLADGPRVWARMIGRSLDLGLNNATDTKIDASMLGMQLGADLYGNQNWKTGLYAAVLDTNSSVKGQFSGGYGGSGSLDSHAYYIGGYATYTADNGFYVDNVVQYGRHSIDARVYDASQSYSPNGDTVTASVEIGKPLRLGESAWRLEPQAQVIYHNADFDDITIKGNSNTKASIDTKGAFMGRVGVRLVGDFQTDVGEIQPYVRANLWQGLSNKDDKTHFSNPAATTTLSSAQRYQSTEVAVGGTWNISDRIQAYGEVGRQYNNNNRNIKVESSVSGSVGFKVRF